MPDSDDPVGHWQRFSAWQQKIVDWLTITQGREVTGVRLWFENGKFHAPDSVR